MPCKWFFSTIVPKLSSNCLEADEKVFGLLLLQRHGGTSNLSSDYLLIRYVLQDVGLFLLVAIFFSKLYLALRFEFLKIWREQLVL